MFQGETKANLPLEIKELIDYFFDEGSILNKLNTSLPEHIFFKCERWRHIGHMGSYYFNPFSLRYKEDHIQRDGTQRVLLICNLKNYNDEIELFLDWIDQYMEFYWGYYLYEEQDTPTFFRIRK
jgi:hypothetical protein